MKIAIASDHAGFELKQFVQAELPELNFVDYGPENDNSVDYPDYGLKAAKAVAGSDCDLGVLICGSGIGMSIIANKVKGIRAALCHNTDLAKLTRAHNNSNILVLAGRFTAKHYALEILKAFLATPFEGGRHQKRIDKITNYEQ